MSVVPDTKIATDGRFEASAAISHFNAQDDLSSDKSEESIATVRLEDAQLSFIQEYDDAVTTLRLAPSETENAALVHLALWHIFPSQWTAQHAPWFVLIALPFMHICHYVQHGQWILALVTATTLLGLLTIQALQICVIHLAKRHPRIEPSKILPWHVESAVLIVGLTGMLICSALLFYAAEPTHIVRAAAFPPLILFLGVCVWAYHYFAIYRRLFSSHDRVDEER
ncbi:MAG: hypothetical protein OHK0022_07060 [Roseiflexaceae bacterium]